MAVRTCRVTCSDSRGVEHTIQVSAQTLYEAVAQALRIFREDAWCEDLWQSAAIGTVAAHEIEQLQPPNCL